MSLPAVKHSNASINTTIKTTISTTIKTAVTLAALATSLCTATAAMAQSLTQQSTVPSATPQQINYNYAGVKYVSQNLDDFDCTQDGLSLYGSMDINSGWFAQASFTDVSGGGCGSSTLAAQGGYRTTFNDTFYMYGTLGLESLSVDAGGDDSGLALAGGLRGFVTPEIEAQFEVSHHTVGDGETLISGMGSYWFKSNIAATAELSFGADVLAIGLGAKMSF